MMSRLSCLSCSDRRRVSLAGASHAVSRRACRRIKIEVRFGQGFRGLTRTLRRTVSEQFNGCVQAALCARVHAGSQAGMQAFVRTRLQTGVKRGGFSEVRMGVGKRADSPSPLRGHSPRPSGPRGECTHEICAAPTYFKVVQVRGCEGI